MNLIYSFKLKHMAEIKIQVPDTDIPKLIRDSKRRGLTLEQFIQADTVNRLVRAPEEWMPMEEWHRRIAGEVCNLCDDLRNEPDPTHFGYKIADLKVSKWYLSFNQYVPGYSIVVLDRHDCLPYQIPEELFIAYTLDIRNAMKALDQTLHPLLVNWEVQGNGTPHLHSHLKPRFHGDLAPGWPIDPNAQRKELTESGYQDRVLELNRALKMNS
jgi:diadenosine tetraphosphate (Ap4A) HIT family hydrolase